jgi:hypothetical protein
VSLAVLATAMGAGFVGMVLGWRGAAARTNVADQLPYVVSGAIGGLALVVFASTVLILQVGRRAEARRRADLGRVRAAVAEIAAEGWREASGGR